MRISMATACTRTEKNLGFPLSSRGKQLVDTWPLCVPPLLVLTSILPCPVPLILCTCLGATAHYSRVDARNEVINGQSLFKKVTLQCRIENWENNKRQPKIVAPSR